MRKIPGFIFILVAITLACNFSGGTPPAESTPIPQATLTQPVSTVTAIPATQTLAPTPPPSLGTIALDFVALLCNAEWMNGGQHLQVCPVVNGDQSGGYAVAIDPVAENLPSNTPVLLTRPATNGYAGLFLRYPSFTIREGDRFRATLRCQTGAACDVEFALEYYGANNKYSGPFLSWKVKEGEAPINVDVDLSVLANQKVDFVLTLRPQNDTPQQDSSLWIAPHIYRP
jgi:hypothetical protein